MKARDEIVDGVHMQCKLHFAKVNHGAALRNHLSLYNRDT